MAASISAPKEEIAYLRQDVQGYEPGKDTNAAAGVCFPEKLYIGLFGRTGCGKTSLINSLKFAVTGKLKRSKWLQVASEEKEGGHTVYRKIADLTKHICVIDNRGFDDSSTERAMDELRAQLDGERSYSEIVKWQEERVEDEEEDSKEQDLDPNDLAAHPIGCVVLVFSAKQDIATNISGLTEIIDFLHVHQGCYPVAVITHVDVATEGGKKELVGALRKYGVSNIFEVANLTTERMILVECHQLSLLNLIDRCMTDGDETLIFKHHQRKEKSRKEAIKRRRKQREAKEEREKMAIEEGKEKEACREEQEMNEHELEVKMHELELKARELEIGKDEIDRKHEQERREETRERYRMRDMELEYRYRDRDLLVFELKRQQEVAITERERRREMDEQMKYFQDLFKRQSEALQMLIKELVLAKDRKYKVM